jgi:glycosyltransferase involved in cell wall biosynthesis
VTDLVVISLERWDEVWRRNQHLLAGLLRRDPDLRVLMVEPPEDPLHALRRRVRPRPGRGLRPGPSLAGVGPGRLCLVEPTKLLPRRLDPRGDARWARGVVRTARRLGLTDPVLWVNDPRGAEVLRLTGWRALYDVTDDWTLAPRTPTETARLIEDERVLLDGCAEVVVCSDGLARSKGAGRPVTVIHNAVDVVAYRHPHPRPADLPAGATAVYVGTIHRDRLDLDLCVDTARAVAGRGRLVLVGPAPLEPRDRQLLEGAGVLLLGPRPRELVPAYLQHADVLVVPHVVTPFTESLDPIKLYEYAAARRPVVSTPVAGFREARSGLIRIAERTGFAAEVLRALTTTWAPSVHLPGNEAPDWGSRVAQMVDVLDRLRTP